MLKKCFSLLMAVILCSTAIIPAFAEIIFEEDAPPHTIIYFSSFDDLSDSSANSVIVLTEEQMICLGSKVRDLFTYTETVYILTQKSVDEIQNICKMSSHIHSKDESLNKFATIIELDSSGMFVFNNISIFYDTDTYTCAIEDLQDNQQLICDGLEAFLTTKSNRISTNSRMQATGFYGYATESAVIYNALGGQIGSMGYTAYFYQVAKSGDYRIFDTICIATFAPNSHNRCKKMSVYLGTAYDQHTVLEAANIVSSGQTYTHALTLTPGVEGIVPSYETSWSYTVEAQDVTKSFNMTTNDRTWIFVPVNPSYGDAWIQEPGIRMCSTRERCHTTVEISYPKYDIFGLEVAQNTLSSNWFFDWT